MSDQKDDDAIARHVEQYPRGLTQHEIARVLGRSARGVGFALARLEAAGRVTHDDDPHTNTHGFRRLWYPRRCSYCGFTVQPSTTKGATCKSSGACPFQGCKVTYLSPPPGYLQAIRFWPEGLDQ